MKYIVRFNKYGLELGDSNNRQELLNAFLGALSGPQNAFNYILTNLSFIEDTIKEVEFEDDNNNRSDSKEITN